LTQSPFSWSLGGRCGGFPNIALMCPFLEGFKGTLNEILEWLQCIDGKAAAVSAQAKSG